MNIKNITVLLILSSVSLLTHTRGLYIYNNSGNTLQYTGTYSGTLSSNGSKSFATTPTILRIKRANGIWIPLETYLIGMSLKKKGLPDQKNGGILSGILTINPNTIESKIGYVDNMGTIK